MVQLYVLRRLFVAGAFLTTLAMADTVADKRNSNTASEHQTLHAAAVDNVGFEAGAIGVLGSAAWLLGGRLRKRLQRPS